MFVRNNSYLSYYTRERIAYFYLGVCSIDSCRKNVLKSLIIISYNCNWLVFINHIAYSSYKFNIPALCSELINSNAVELKARHKTNIYRFLN